jgi:hypothetical protein
MIQIFFIIVHHLGLVIDVNINRIMIYRYHLVILFKSIILTNYTGGTCYRFLNGCNHGLWPLCLDWREICDGKIDCLNGEDQEWCDQLEVNKYRCHYVFHYHF